MGRAEERLREIWSPRSPALVTGIVSLLGFHTPGCTSRFTGFSESHSWSGCLRQMLPVGSTMSAFPTGKAEAELWAQPWRREYWVEGPGLWANEADDRRVRVLPATPRQWEASTLLCGFGVGRGSSDLQRNERSLDLQLSPT